MVVALNLIDCGSLSSLQVNDAVHAAGGKIFAQLWHIGRTAHPLHQAGQPNLGPSAIAAKGGQFRLLAGEPGYVVPQAIKDPRIIIEQYKVRSSTRVVMVQGF